MLQSNDLKGSIIGSTETSLEEDAQASMYKIDGYSKFIPGNRSWGPRGGVGLYLDKNFKYRVLLRYTIRQWLTVLLPVCFLVIVTYRCEKRFSKIEFCEWLLAELRELKNRENGDLSERFQHRYSSRLKVFVEN